MVGHSISSLWWVVNNLLLLCHYHGSSQQSLCVESMERSPADWLHSRSTCRTSESKKEAASSLTCWKYAGGLLQLLEMMNAKVRNTNRSTIESLAELITSEWLRDTKCISLADTLFFQLGHSLPSRYSCSTRRMHKQQINVSNVQPVNRWSNGSEVQDLTEIQQTGLSLVTSSSCLGQRLEFSHIHAQSSKSAWTPYDHDC